MEQLGEATKTASHVKHQTLRKERNRKAPSTLAVIAQLVARRSHNPKVVSSILTYRTSGLLPTVLVCHFGLCCCAGQTGRAGRAGRAGAVATPCPHRGHVVGAPARLTLATEQLLTFAQRQKKQTVFQAVGEGEATGPLNYGFGP